MQTIDLGIVGKTLGGATQLVRRGSIFGVENRQELAPCFQQSDVQCARLGHRRSRRRQYQPVGGVGPQRLHRLTRLDVVRFDDELDVEFAPRIIEGFEGAHEIGDDARFLA